MPGKPAPVPMSSQAVHRSGAKSKSCAESNDVAGPDIGDGRRRDQVLGRCPPRSAYSRNRAIRVFHAEHRSAKRSMLAPRPRSCRAALGVEQDRREGGRRDPADARRGSPASSAGPRSSRSTISFDRPGTAAKSSAAGSGTRSPLAQTPTSSLGARDTARSARPRHLGDDRRIDSPPASGEQRRGDIEGKRSHSNRVRRAPSWLTAPPIAADVCAVSDTSRARRKRAALECPVCA